jgi:DNA-binding MurR/RpiR family transcriptional regulator
MNTSVSQGRQIVIIIKRLIPSLNPKERLIAEYILSFPSEISTITITEMAEKLQVSQGSIVKFCKKLGLEGFAELKEQFNSSPTHYFDEEFEISDSPKQILMKSFKNSIQAMTDCLNSIHEETFENVCHILMKAPKIDLYGFGGSGVIAMDAYHKFLRIGLNSAVFTDHNMQLMSASLLKKGDVAIGISHSGRTTAIVNSLRLAKQVGATTIAITNFADMPLTNVADYSLFSVAGGNPITGENATARLAQLAILDALFIYLSLHKKDAMKNLAKTIDSVKISRIE